MIPPILLYPFLAGASVSVGIHTGEALVNVTRTQWARLRQRITGKAPRSAAPRIIIVENGRIQP